jgi:hypothetical protein
MKEIKEKFTLLGVSLVSVMALAIMPVAAQGSGSSGSGSTSDSGKPTSLALVPGGLKTEAETQATTEAESQRPEVQNRVELLHSQAKLDIAKMRAENKDTKETKTAEQRQKVCENRQKAVDNKLSAFSNAANDHLTRLNNVFTKLQDYHTANPTAASNYATLLAAARANQTTAIEAVATLKATNTSFSCTATTDPAAGLRAAKTAAANARDALKAYRTSLKDIVVAFAQAKDTTNTKESN